jgi:hypothetical protein
MRGTPTAMQPVTPLDTLEIETEGPGLRAGCGFSSRQFRGIINVVVVGAVVGAFLLPVTWSHRRGQEDTVEFFDLILGTPLTTDDKQDLVVFLRAR